MRRLLVLLACLLVAAACGDAAAPSTTSPPTAPTTTAPGDDSYTLDDHLDWFLGVLGGDPVDEADYERRFAPEFRAAVPYDAFVAPLAGLAGEWSVAGEDRSAGGTEVALTLTPATGATLEAAMVIEPGPPGRIAGLLLRPADLEDPPQTLDEAVDRWAGLAPQAALLVAEGDCQPVAAVDPEERLAIGSVFKLWVLAALVEAIAAGDAAWDEPLAIRDELKSLPSGVLQDEPAGTELALREYALQMIASSDNTATDHLIDRLTRWAVELAQEPYGHGDPAVNEPFPTTRELFWLKLAASPETVATYVGGDEQTRRAILEGAVIDLSGIDPFAFTEPQDIDTIEWFASPADVCGALATLAATGSAEVAAILGENRGADLDPATWPEVAFKGGSEPGVLALAWRAERADGTAYTVVGMLNDPRQPVDEVTAVLLAQAIFGLLAGA